MPKYNVVESFTLENQATEVGSVVELSEEVAAPLLEEGKVTLVEESGEQNEGQA